MKNFLDIARSRYSSREYLVQPVEKDKIDIILEAARIAPSAANKQPYLFYVITDEKLKQSIFSIYPREWFKNAPVIIVGCINKIEAWVRADGKNHGDIDLAIAVDHMTLQAADLGLATCWICNFDIVKCKEILNLPDNLEPAVLLPIAYPADIHKISSHLDQRKSIEKLVIWK